VPNTYFNKEKSKYLLQINTCIPFDLGFFSSLYSCLHAGFFRTKLIHIQLILSFLLGCRKLIICQFFQENKDFMLTKVFLFFFMIVVAVVQISYILLLFELLTNKEQLFFYFSASTNELCWWFSNWQTL